jgi:hypothetical protein
VATPVTILTNAQPDPNQNHSKDSAHHVTKNNGPIVRVYFIDPARTFDLFEQALADSGFNG